MGKVRGYWLSFFLIVKGSSIYAKREGFSLDLALVSLEGILKKSCCSSSRVETTLAAVAEAQRL